MSPKEISLQILNPDSDFPAWEDFESLARAYLELEKKYEQQINYIEKVLIPTNKITIHRVLDDKSQYFENRLFIANDEIAKLKEENEKLKKSREVLRSALEHTWPGSTYAIDVNAFNRNALKADSEIMEGK